MKNRKLLTFFALAFCVLTVQAKVKLPAIFSDNMVLQQQSENKIWGKAKANATISVTTSWDGKSYTTQSDSNGRFELKVQTPAYGGPYSIDVSDGEVLTLNNILIGEVWLCSGQSNMEMPLKGFRGQPINGSQEKIVGARPTQNLRLFTVKRAHNTSPQDDVEGTWMQSSPKTAREFSATAYFFGDLLQKTLDIPVGLIHSSWSASKIEPWMSKETLSAFSDVDLSVLSKEYEKPTKTPTVIYNAMIHPIEGLSIKGVIWYQGESNSTNPEQYKHLFAAWINQWRKGFNNPQMPFYYTEIAPYRASGKDGDTLPLFREAQLESMKEIENVGMAFTTDIGDEKFIHPPFKKEVGERLAYWALAKTYNMEGIAYMGPVFKEGKLVDKNKVEVTFDYAEEGLIPEKTGVLGFEIAGADGVFYPAEATIMTASAKVHVWSDEVSAPAEVRYCFRNYTEGNLANNVGLPAFGFRAKIQQ